MHHGYLELLVGEGLRAAVWLTRSPLLIRLAVAREDGAQPGSLNRGLELVAGVALQPLACRGEVEDELLIGQFTFDDLRRPPVRRGGVLVGGDESLVVGAVVAI